MLLLGLDFSEGMPSGEHLECKTLQIHAQKIITKTSLFKYTENFTTKKKKNENFQIKILIFFHISAQNIDYGYSLEPP